MASAGLRDTDGFEVAWAGGSMFKPDIASGRVGWVPGAPSVVRRKLRTRLSSRSPHVAHRSGPDGLCDLLGVFRVHLPGPGAQTPGCMREHRPRRRGASRERASAISCSPPAIPWMPRPWPAIWTTCGTWTASSSRSSASFPSPQATRSFSSAAVGRAEGLTREQAGQIRPGPE
jgi:hypothetical protein